MPTTRASCPSRDLGRRLVLQQGDPRTSSGGLRGVPSLHNLDTLESDVATMTPTVGRVNSLTLLLGPLLRWHPHHRRRC